MFSFDKNALAALGERDRRLAKRCADVLWGNRFPQMRDRFGGRVMLSPAVSFFRGVWNWDSAFHAVALARFDPVLARDQIEGFLSLMKDDGMLPDCIKEDGREGWHSSKPPVFAWAAWQVYRRCGDEAFLRRVYAPLVRNEHFWREQRFDGTLFFYAAYQSGSPDDVLKWAKWETGLDDSPRWDNGVTDLYPVDLNVYMLLTYRALADIAQVLGEDGALWRSRAADLEALIEDTFWNGAAGMYTDRNRVTGAFSPVLTPVSFFPLFAKTASPERAQRMAALAADERKFRSTMPSVAFDDPEYSDGYWRGPMWLNIAYFAAKGLKNYELPVADDIRENVLALAADNGDAIYENYDLSRGIGTHAKDFSWSACFLLEFLLEWEK